MIEDKFLKLKMFLNANGLQMNDSKTTLTEYMSCQKRAKSQGIPPELTVTVLEKGVMVDKLIVDSPISRTLGINLENNLGWTGHLQTGKKTLLPSIRRQIGALSSQKETVSRKGKLQLVNALILSRISYLICVWGNSAENVKKKVQIVQNMAGQFVTGQGRRTRQVDILKECNCADELTTYHSMIQLWKMIYLKKPRLNLNASAFRSNSVLNWKQSPSRFADATKTESFQKEVEKLVDRKERNGVIDLRTWTVQLMPTRYGTDGGVTMIKVTPCDYYI